MAELNGRFDSHAGRKSALVGPIVQDTSEILPLCILNELKGGHVMNHGFEARIRLTYARYRLREVPQPKAAR